MKGAKEVLGEFHDKARDNAKEAAGALTGASRVVNGHARCEVAQNGAPDCAVAANTRLHRQGLQDRQERRHADRREVPVAGLALGPLAVCRRVQSRDLRHARGLPVIAILVL